MKGMFIVNPNSGMQTHQNTAHSVVRTLLREGILTEARIVYTTGKNSAREAAASVKAGECDFIMAVGGDGTVNETVCGIMDGGQGIPLAILRAGTSNDFAAAMGLPSDVQGVVRMIREYKVKPVDVGVVNGKYFLNVTAGGLLSDIAHNVSSEQKTALGRMAYYIEGVKSIGELKLDTVPLRFETDGFSFETETFLMIIANSNSVGGFLNIAPKACVDDGKLDVCLLKNIKPADIVPVFTQVQMGTHVTNSKCVTYFQTDRISIKPLDKNKNFVTDYDGECGDELPIDISVLPRALNLMIPDWKSKTKKMFCDYNN